MEIIGTDLIPGLFVRLGFKDKNFFIAIYSDKDFQNLITILNFDPHHFKEFHRELTEVLYKYAGLDEQ